MRCPESRRRTNRRSPRRRNLLKVPAIRRSTPSSKSGTGRWVRCGRLNDSIEDEGISAQIDHLEEVTRKIIDLVVKQPKKLPQIRRFMDYYLPTTLKLLNAYDRMDSTGIAGDNITATKDKVSAMMDTIVRAFDRQLDACSARRPWTSPPTSP